LYLCAPSKNVKIEAMRKKKRVNKSLSNPADLGPAKLVEGKKRWYIEYYLWNWEQDKAIRKREYDGLNNSADRKERIAFAKNRIKELNKTIKKNNAAPPDKILKSTMIGALEEALEKKKPYLRQTSQRHYKNTIDSFTGYLRSVNKQTLALKHLTTELVSDYILNLSTSAVTKNAHLNSLHILCTQLIKANFMQVNPCDNIQKFKVDTTRRNMAFSDPQIQTLKTKFLTDNPYLWEVVQFIYYCFIRKKELCMLKVKHVELENSRIFVPGDISKNGKSAYVTIPDGLIPLLDSWSLSELSGDLFLISQDKKPGPKRYSSKTLSELHHDILQDLNFSVDYTFYSWKHTGVVKAFKAGIHIKSLQRQLRHSSLEMVDKYQQSLGLETDTEIGHKFPVV